MCGRRIVLLELVDEVAAYIAAGPQIDDCVIALTPQTRSALLRHGITARDTVPFFPASSHADCLVRANKMLEWLRERFMFTDDLGVTEAYADTLLWYSRCQINYFVWLAEIIHNVASVSNGETIWAVVGDDTSAAGCWLGEKERYAGMFAARYCVEHGRLFRPIMRVQDSEDVGEKRAETHGASTTGLPNEGISAVARMLYRAYLRSLAKDRPLMTVATGYRMGTVIEQAEAALPGQRWLVVTRLKKQPPAGVALLEAARAWRSRFIRSRFIQGGSGRDTITPVRLDLLLPGSEKVDGKRRRLEQTLNAIAGMVEAAPSIFSHHGMSFADLFARKIRVGIAPALYLLQRQAVAVYQLLRDLKPRLVIGPFSREIFFAMGEICRHRKIPTFMISHGSFTRMKNELEELSWTFHGRGLLHTAFETSALQSPLAEEHVAQLVTETKFIKTGPLAWGGRVDEERARRLRSSMFPKSDDVRVILHAGTPKPRAARQFHVYETSDEYIAALCDLVKATADIANTRLVIRFRPNAELSIDTLKTLVPMPSHVVLSTEGEFLDVLGIADLLVSFSSTTIEEALQNSIPILLYGGDGRYVHTAALAITPKGRIRPSAVYSVAKREHLADSLGRILAAHENIAGNRELFRPYVYDQEEVQPVGRVFARCLQTI